MKRLILAVMILTMWTSMAMASPFLVCNPQTGVTKYQVSLDAGATWQDVAPDGSGEYGFKLDLEGIGNGTYNALAKACNMWGCSSDSLPFGFDVQRCGAPQTLQLLSE